MFHFRPGALRRTLRNFRNSVSRMSFENMLNWQILKQTLFRFFFYGIFSIIIGAIVGATVSIFGQMLLEINELRDAHPWYFIPFLGLAGVVLIWVYANYSGPAKRGMGLIFDIGNGKKDATIPFRMAPLTMFATWMTHLFGGSAGREGVAVQIGSAISMQFVRLQPNFMSRHIFLAIGMSAGFAAMFGTPIAATFFALEVLVVGSVFYDDLVPALIAAYTASAMARYLGLGAMTMPIGEVPDMNTSLMIITVIAGIGFGVVGWLFSWLLNFFRYSFAFLIHHPMLRIFIVGSLLAAVLLLCDAERYAGLSEGIFVDAYTGGDIYPWDWIVKMLFTTITLSVGFQGGELTPLFVIGTSLGATVAMVFGLPVALFAAMGCISVFGAATKTMFTPIFVGAEVFGAQALPYFMLVAIVAFVISGHSGIYGGQKYLSREAFFKAWSDDK